MALVCGARSLAPTVARSLLDYGGRNVYAALQLVMVALGTLTVTGPNKRGGRTRT